MINETLQDKIQRAVNERATPAAERIASKLASSMALDHSSKEGLDPKPLTLMVESLSTKNANQVAHMLGTGFSGEPLGLSVGLDGEENYKCIFDMCVDAARVEETTGRDLSVVVRTSDGTIIGACICTTAEAYGASNDPPSDTSDAAKRLFAVMNSAFKKARLRIVELGMDPCVPELALSCVHPDFRGSFIKDDDGNPTRSMYQEMCHTIEQKVALYWNGMYSHSNNTSAKRHEKSGWTTVFRVAYTDLEPQEYVISPQQGHLNVCYRQFDKQ